ncbi:MAG: Holliday junction resolvase RuvX [Thermoanaerobaculia bacterium]
MRALGIDFGERRIGIAISDPGGTYALPLETLTRVDDASAITAIAAIAEREEIAWIAVGEPLRADGSAGPPALRARRFATRLGITCGVPVEMIDETLTSRSAESRQREAGIAPPRRRAGRKPDGRLDALSAQLLLQEALDRRQARLPRIPPSE